MDQLEQLSQRSERNFKAVFEKLDAIIQRNSEADKKIAVLQNEINNHSQVDADNFKAIYKKHTWYDKFIIGTLVFAVTQLITVVMFFAIHK